MTQKCRVCSCTDDDCILCIALAGGPCWWVEQDLCSRCAPDQVHAGQVLARQVAQNVVAQAVVPGAIVTMLDRHGHLQVGIAAVDAPVSAPLLELAGGIHAAVERIMGARGQPRPPVRAACSHCGVEIERDDAGAVKAHVTSCEANPLVAELKRLREQLAAKDRQLGELGAQLTAFQTNLKPIDVVFDGPPGHESGRFVEVENAERRSINVGSWIDRGDGCWALRVWADCTPTATPATEVSRG